MSQFATVFSLSIILFFQVGCGQKYSEETIPSLPNIILIMADDMGYECVGANESISYQTPNLDTLAQHGLHFEHCYSQPLCTPSRVKIMTGLSNYRNYTTFGHLADGEHTFAQVLKEAGYATCIAGKWQLNGFSWKNDKQSGWDDPSRPLAFGFDEYCLWQLSKPVWGENGERRERYASPYIEQNGTTLTDTENAYGPDLFADFICDFIARHKNERFFAYYPMVLPHAPFVSTPLDSTWQYKDQRYKNDTAYFKSMVKYLDQLVGQIHHHTKDLGIDQNTLFIFTADNGTDRKIQSSTNNGLVKGGKGTMLDRGTHVPLMMVWPDQFAGGRPVNHLVDFSDFFATFAHLVKDTSFTDGHSLLPLLTGKEFTPRKHVVIHYDPIWSKNVNRHRNRFIRNQEYKWYQDDRFYNMGKDPEETHSLKDSLLSSKELKLKSFFNQIEFNHPEWN